MGKHLHDDKQWGGETEGSLTVRPGVDDERENRHTADVVRGDLPGFTMVR